MNTTVSSRYTDLVEAAGQRYRESGEAAKIRVQVGSATCEDAAGSAEVLEEFRKYIAASGRQDIVLHRTGCTGRCSREPIVGVFVPGQMPLKYERVTREIVHKVFTSHIVNGTPVLEHVLDGPAKHIHQYEFLFCSSDRCGRALEKRFRTAFLDKLQKAGMDLEHIRAMPASCFGACSEEQIGTCVHLLVMPSHVLYRIRNDEDLDEIIAGHVMGGQVVRRLMVESEPIGQEFFELYGDVAFFNKQCRIALRNCGVVNPESVEEYFRFKGFSALAKVLAQGDPAWVIGEVSQSNLRGRGGAGYPTGLKWKMASEAADPLRYLICNADEGDPGAFMDRSMLESDPFSVIEGMIIGGFAIGAHRGFFYVRAEYPMAIRRIQNAIESCRRNGLLGKDILGSGFDFDLEIRLGAGAFVCGEETALIHSIEGERGQPRIRPPYPTERGLWNRPTVINNVETLANVPVIISYGGGWFKRIGTAKSGGSKVFALAGKVKNTGLVEVPMGTSLREVVLDIGGGVPDGKALKAIQTGGPAGGCIPAQWLDTLVDYDNLTQAGSIMGSGGMIVMDEADCMVDIAKFFLTFSQDESCGKCTPCREGTKRMLEILERITSGTGVPDDLRKLERLAKLIKKASLCGLGRAAPNPVLSTLTHFRDEYEAHVKEKRCPAVKCRSLLRYEISTEKCVGCTVCARNCPVECISGVRKEVHVIDQLKCIKCGRCFEVCRFNAVDRK